jgi:hypothetical protein
MVELRPIVMWDVLSPEMGFGFNICVFNAKLHEYLEPQLPIFAIITCAFSSTSFPYDIPSQGMGFSLNFLFFRFLFLFLLINHTNTPIFRAPIANFRCNKLCLYASIFHGALLSPTVCQDIPSPRIGFN